MGLNGKPVRHDERRHRVQGEHRRPVTDDELRKLKMTWAEPA